MEKIQGRLVERIKRTPTIESFRFILEKKAEFIPGQFLRIIFDEQNKDSKELNKYLSFSSSPVKDYIEVTKRISESKFSFRLSGLKINDNVLFNASLGKAVFKDSYNKIGFLIGGIGITPVISILEYIIDKKLKTNVTLFYSNRAVEEIAFRQELDFWRKINEDIKVFYLITDSKTEDKDCILGLIDKDIVLEKMSDITERVVFTFGPPGMVEVMKNLCLQAGCKRENLKSESFIGY